ncbi:MAG: type transport system ATP-binding protein [Solirubrobacteraceae bacterium]|nr:type transport system ATP-binding protein [Solirubrobacteraceae bacterium]
MVAHAQSRAPVVERVSVGERGGVPVVIDASAVTVRRGGRVVLSDVSLAVGAGQLVHLAGANGSGKTSLLRVLAGLSAPRVGTVRRPARCAFVGEKVTLAGSVRAGEWLTVMRGLRGLPAADWRAAVRDAGLEPSVLSLPAARHSKGMLQRLTLIEATEPGCDALLLDEPFVGLDAAGHEWLARRLLSRLAAGAAVLLTDHSGAAIQRLPVAAVLRLDGGRCTLDAGATAPAPLLHTTLPDGQTLTRAIADPSCAHHILLAEGWQIDDGPA